MRLIHYGAPYYVPELFKPISDEPFRNKSRGGLWASPIDSEYGWKEWADENEWGDTKSSFEIEFSGNLLVIDGVKDMEKLPWIESNGHWFISFQALCPLEFIYDAIHLTKKGECETRFTHPKSLYGWDCECVYVMNPDAIRVV